MKTTIAKIEDGKITENPFWEDHYNMGTQLSNELWLMHEHFVDKPFMSAYLYNIKTGERFRVCIE